MTSEFFMTGEELLLTSRVVALYIEYEACTNWDNSKNMKRPMIQHNMHLLHNGERDMKIYNPAINC